MNLKIPWTPHAKGRPRVTKTGQAYTPEATRRAEKAIRQAFEERYDEGPLEGPLEVTVVLRNDEFDIGVRAVGDYEHRKLRGDVDNYAKTILDALNGAAWIDDKQIRTLVVMKA